MMVCFGALIDARRRLGGGVGSIGFCCGFDRGGASQDGAGEICRPIFPIVQGPTLLSRACARANSSAAGQAEAIATLTRQMLMRISDPIFSSLRRRVPQVAWADWVCARPMRRSAQTSTVGHGGEP